MATGTLTAWADRALVGPSYAEAARLLRTFAGLTVGPATFLSDLRASGLAPTLLPIATLADGRTAVLHFHPDLVARSRVPVALGGEGLWIDQAGSLRVFTAQMLALHRRDGPASELVPLLRRFRWATGGGRPWPDIPAPVDERGLFRALGIQGPDHQLADWVDLADAAHPSAPAVLRDLARAWPLHPARALAAATREGAWEELVELPAYTAGSARSARTMRAAAEAFGVRATRVGARGRLLAALDERFLEGPTPGGDAQLLEAAGGCDPGGPLHRCVERMLSLPPVQAEGGS